MTQVEKKAQPYLPFIPISGNSPHRKSTIELHGTATDLTIASRQCGVHPLTQVGHNHTPSQNPAIQSYYAPFFSPLPNSHFTPKDILSLTQFTFSSVSQPFDSQHTHHLSLIHI